MTSNDTTWTLCGTCADNPADGPDGNCTECRGEWAIRNLPDVWPDDDPFAGIPNAHDEWNERF